MRTYLAMYMPVLKTFGIVLIGYGFYLFLNGGGIDPGPPNAKYKARS